MNKTTKQIKLGKTARCGYIYADRHAIIIHEDRHPKAGSIEWVEIFERIDTHCNFQGRIVFHNPNYDNRLALALNAYELRATEPSCESGSENTKNARIRVGYFEIGNKDGHSLSWIRTPDIISDGLTYQPENTDTFAEAIASGSWCGKRINTIHRAEVAADSAIAA